MTKLLSLLIGWMLDLLVGDPQWLPHPVVGFGKMIAFGEHRLNRGQHRMAKGALLSIFLILMVFALTWFLLHLISLLPSPFGEGMGVRLLIDAIIVFYCLAGTTLIREVREVFLALDRSLEEGRRQVSRIVGRDTSELSAQEVRTAALETLAENLSDGVIAPLFWFAILGTPGMLTYKMINTLDSMIGYRTERYRDFGCWAAHIDDIANYIPARLTALLMILPRIVNCQLSIVNFVRRYILNCRFGGPHYYFGQLFDKPFIGENDRPLTTDDMKKAVLVNRTAEVLMILIVGLCAWMGY